jgi:YidC/Oxa1 family membrane protein insertase
MSHGIFGTLVTTPLYNGLVLLMHALPWADLGIIVIIFTCIVRLILFPLAQKSVRTQIVMQEIQPEIDKLKQRYKDNPQEQAAKIMALYKERGLNPFASILFMFIQIPIIFGLYFMFLRSGLPAIDPAQLYSFVSVPAGVSTMFLGLVSVTAKSIPLAILAGGSQFLQAQFAKPPEIKNDGERSFGREFTKSLHFQMRYVFPVIIIFIASALPASIALYWITSNLFSTAQEIWTRRKLATEHAA